MKKYIYVTNQPNTQTRIQREIRAQQTLGRESIEGFALNKYSDANPAKRFAAEEGAGVRKRMLSACRKQELEEHQRRGWDGGIRTHDIRVKVWCVTITLHPNIGAKTTGIGITPNPRFRGVGKGVRTLDTRNHNPVLSRLSYTHHRSEMVRQEGFEPPAYCLEGGCSIRLSYWRAYNIWLPAQKVWSG